ncbi:hypothetical protein GCM10007103_35010 [Salinimicrobium marinum]|uniref:Reverse transcriptase domain-containing protein n=1 Tax=Salinimicrobium marinum TaxID=680283 RepID=A0A918SN35_9FLAO|nr:reverse transcriptase domain-containing protein [Salinimicrobium marinum]GHA51518.1 hypothetical protein GCM10007103_35010 [Salinimicrobium marinum]
MNQYSRFLSLENFEIAFYRLKTAQRNLYKTIYYPDLKIFETFLESNLRTLINQIESSTYSPEKSNKLFIPKKNELVRPLSVLKFTDLIVYQAIANVVADVTYDQTAPLYSRKIFGNIPNITSAPEEDRIFFYKPWKASWKDFSKRSIKYFKEGYEYLSEFDIASFFDTIDHQILLEILNLKYSVDDNVLILLGKCLETWTADYNHKGFHSKHGIPQGPISSPLFADIYLMYLDEEITSKKLDIQYLRYVDDIRIFSKNVRTSRKAIAALDLISRDIGLIPQGHKIKTKKILDIEKELKTQNNSFSAITKEYRKNTEGKEKNSIKSKTHRKLKTRFIDCFEEDDSKRKEDYLDKTVISFSLFKLNKDDDVKKLIISNYELLLTHFDTILFYLKKHYDGDQEVISFLEAILIDEDILFHHIIALIFKWFPNLQFNEKVFGTYATQTNRNWLVRYFMVDWLYQNKKTDLFEILLNENNNNYFIKRKINEYKFILSGDLTFKKYFTIKLLQEKNDILALQGLYLSLRNLMIFLDIEYSNDLNSYVKAIKGGDFDDFITKTLKEEYKIQNSETFFNRNIWSSDETYKELNDNLIAYEKFRFSEPAIAILNLNNFNNLCFDTICARLKIKKAANEFGVNLNAKIIEEDFPKTNRYWEEINSKRNQRTDAHPYDRFGKIRVKIKREELIKLHHKQLEALQEICNYRNY